MGVKTSPRLLSLALVIMALAAGGESVRLALVPARPPPAPAAVLIEQGLRLEIAGDLAGAERSLEAAAAADRTSKPLFTLASFEARHGRADPFRRWAARLAALPGADLRGLFVTAFRFDAEAERIPAMLPSRAEPWRQWLLATMATGRLDLAGNAALRLTALDTSADRWRAALDFCDRSIAAGEAAPALAVWQALYARRRVASPAPSAAAPVTNGSFVESPGGHGFDWRVHEPAGVGRAILPGALRFEFRGGASEAAGVILAEQWMPFDPRARYLAVWRAEDSVDAIDVVLPDGQAVAAAAGSARFEAPRSLGRVAIRLTRRPAGAHSGVEAVFHEFRIDRAGP